MNLITSRGAVLLVFALIAMALSAGLFAAPANRMANRQAGLLLLVLAGIGAAYAIDISRLDRSYLWLRHLPMAVPLAIGPLLYGYVRGLATGAGMPRVWLHAAAPLLQFTYLIVFFLLPDNTQNVLDDGRGRDWVRRLLDLALLASLAGYAIAGLALLHRYRAWLITTRSDADLYVARWVRNLLVVLLLILAAQTVMRAHIWFVGRLSVFDVYGFYLWLGAAGVYIGVEARRYAERRFPIFGETPPAAIAARDWTALGARWRDRVWESGWWREPGLTLGELARRLATNTSHLSRAINEGLGQNFSETINGMRAREVARRLDAEPGSDNDLLQLAFEAGFSSKASFNRAFRARHGVTPSEYRARARRKS